MRPNGDGSPLESGGFGEESMLTNGCSVERVSKQVHKGKNSITPTERQTCSRINDDHFFSAKNVQMVRHTFF